MTQTVADVIAYQVRRFRKERGLTVERLSEICTKTLGATGLTPASITNIERPAADGVRKRPRRAVAVDELLVLAEALTVPPLALLLPDPAAPAPAPSGALDATWDRASWVEVLPGKPVPMFRAWQWITGEALLDDGGPPWLGAGESGPSPAQMRAFQQGAGALRSIYQYNYLLRDAELALLIQDALPDNAPEREKVNVEARVFMTLGALHGHRWRCEQLGIDLPALPDTVAAAMDKHPHDGPYFNSVRFGQDPAGGGQGG